MYHSENHTETLVSLKIMSKEAHVAESLVMHLSSTAAFVRQIYIYIYISHSSEKHITLECEPEFRYE